MHSVPISITATHATITVSATAQAGSTISVDWTGPNLPNDNLDIGQVGADGSHLWENFASTSAGSPVDILVPTEVGDYEITYFIGQDRTKLTTVPISVTEVTASITAPPTAIAGSTIDVSWTGPDYDNDYIGIGAVGATGSAQGSAFADTNAGNPVTITLPDAPGDNVISYFLQQDRTTIATRPLRLNRSTNCEHPAGGLNLHGRLIAQDRPCSPSMLLMASGLRRTRQRKRAALSGCPFNYALRHNAYMWITRS